MSLSDYIPYVRFTISTSLDQKEVHRRLSEHISNFTLKFLLFRIRPQTYFVGYINTAGFKMNIIDTQNRNGIGPFVSGYYVPVNKKLNIYITMRTSFTTSIFMLSFALAAVTATCCILIHVICTLHFIYLIFFSAFLLPFYFYVSTLNSFNESVANVKNVFNELLSEELQ